MGHVSRLMMALCALVVSISVHAFGAAKTAEDFVVADTIVEHCAASNHVRIYGKDRNAGEHVVIVPSLGRGVEDYTEAYGSTITTRLVEAGYRVVLIQPRGIGRSTGDLTAEHASMSLFAQDIRQTLDTLGIKRAHFVGHAFGNRLVRTFATLFPAYVDHLVLMAAGGNFDMSEEQRTSLRDALNVTLDDGRRLKAIARAFFADGNDPRVWLGGWYPELARAQVFASNAIDADFFKAAGGKPFLVIQAVEDYIAPPDRAGRVLKAELEDQVRYVEIQGAGHALSPEQPDAVAERIASYLADVD